MPNDTAIYDAATAKQCIVSSIRPMVLTMHELLYANCFAESMPTPASVFYW